MSHSIAGSRARHPVLMMVTDRRRGADAAGSAGSRLIDTIERAVRAGVDAIQIRERDLEAADLLALTQQVRHVAAGTAAKTIVNDRADVAIAAQAEGVHLPSHGVSPAVLRRLLPPGMSIGRSVHTIEEAIAAERGGGCDYLLFGTVFESNSKAPGHIVAGLDALRRTCAAVRLPVLAIGGITAPRIPDVAGAGAVGIAAIGLFADGSDDQVMDAVRAARAAFAHE